MRRILNNIFIYNHIIIMSFQIIINAISQYLIILIYNNYNLYFCLYLRYIQQSSLYNKIEICKAKLFWVLRDVLLLFSSVRN